MCATPPQREICPQYVPCPEIAAEVERHPDRRSGDIEVYSPEEVHALLRTAADERDAAVFATAAFTGLRMGELRALRWRDVDFPRSVIRVRASYAAGEFSVPKSGKVRSVPMVDEAAQRLARLSERDLFVGDDDLVFAELDGTWLSDDRLRRRYEAAMKAAGLRRLRFHDLRHTFGSLAITRADIVEVQPGWATRTSRRRCDTCTVPTAVRLLSRTKASR